MIFYFSATGNCKNVAQILAERTGERAVAIADELIRADMAPAARESCSR